MYFNRLTGFVEVYSSDTKFENEHPFSPNPINRTASLTGASGDFFNGATKRPIATLSFLNSVKIKSSFKTLTDTAELVIPRVDNWLIYDEYNVNNKSLYDPQAFDNEQIFSSGNIVRVFLGYDFQDKLMFHGYVSKVSNTSPLTLKLEDGMYLLKQKVVNGIYKNKDDETKDVRLSDFIDDLIEGTGVELHPSVRESADEISFGKYFHAKQSTSARVMKDIQDRGLSVFFEAGKLIIGRTYFDSSLTPHISTISNPDYVPPVINNEINVPKGGNKLETTTMNKKRNMVTVQRFIGNSRILQINVALDPFSREDKFVIAAIHDTINKKSDVNKERLTAWLIKNYDSNIDTAGYSQITATMDTTTENFDSTNLDNYKPVVDKMFAHGQDMFWKYFDSGLGGSITTYGDFGLQSAQSVSIIDPRNPEVAGEYLITGVATDWGFSVGYRQNLKVGIKIKDYPKGLNIYHDSVIEQINDSDNVLGSSNSGVENIA